MYCGNCGCKTKNKICKECGTKTKKGRNYCRWCGNQLELNAIICTSCGERVKSKKIGYIIDILMVIFNILILSNIYENLEVYEKNRSDDTRYLTFLLIEALCYVVSIMFSSTIFRNIVKKKTVSKKKKRFVINLVRYIVAIIFIVIGLQISDINNETYNSTLTNVEGVDVFTLRDEDAVDQAVQYFHQNVSLKNESSFILNDSSVIKHQEDENTLSVLVTLDYSAQNGFGGYNRSKCMISMKYNTSTGNYLFDYIIEL